MNTRPQAVCPVPRDALKQLEKESLPWTHADGFILTDPPSTLMAGPQLPLLGSPPHQVLLWELRRGLPSASTASFTDAAHTKARSRSLARLPEAGPSSVCFQ